MHEMYVAMRHLSGNCHSSLLCNSAFRVEHGEGDATRVCCMKKAAAIRKEC